MKKILLVSSVKMSRPHPSGMLANIFAERGADIAELFLDSRSVINTVVDAFKLYLKIKSCNYDSVLINVNGSINQSLVVYICRKFNVKSVLWVLDCYPGCLVYVTKAWWMFYIPFFFATYYAKKYSTCIKYTDEEFPKYAPIFQFRSADSYVPLPILDRNSVSFKNRVENVVGLIGNLENSWLEKHYINAITKLSDVGYRVLVASSKEYRYKIEGCDIEIHVPWPKELTNYVFEKCAYFLVPISTARMIYSSPSKIIEAYSYGIQPILFVERNCWEENKHRNIYKYCVHFDDFVLNKKKYEPHELVNYSKMWTNEKILDLMD